MPGFAGRFRQAYGREGVLTGADREHPEVSMLAPPLAPVMTSSLPPTAAEGFVYHLA